MLPIPRCHIIASHRLPAMYTGIVTVLCVSGIQMYYYAAELLATHMLCKRSLSRKGQGAANTESLLGPTPSRIYYKSLARVVKFFS